MRTMLYLETKLVLRDALLPLLGIALPLVLFIGFGVIPASRQPDAQLGGLRPIDTVLPSMAITVAVAMTGFVMLPAYLATYRERGILRRLATTPVRPSRMLAVQLILHVVVFASSVALMLGVGAAALGMRGPRHPVEFLVALTLAVLGLFAVGLVIASVARSAKTANGLGMLAWFGSAFFAGIYIPRELLPHALQRACDFTPLGAARQALQASWGGAGLPWLDTLVLVVTAGAALTYAARRFRWE